MKLPVPQPKVRSMPLKMCADGNPSSRARRTGRGALAPSWLMRRTFLAGADVLDSARLPPDFVEHLALAIQLLADEQPA